MLKTIFVNAIKLLVAGALIAWLINSGKLDFKLLAQLKNYPISVLTAVSLCIFNFCLATWRWTNILRARSTAEFPFFGMLKVTWIGQFFSSVLPGSVTGDLVKILYIQRYDKNFTKKFVFASIIIDRAMGLAGLIILVGTTSVFFYSHILKNAPAMQPLLNMNFMLTVVVITSLLVFFFFHKIIRSLFVRFEQFLFPKVWQQIIALWDDLIAIKPRMIKSLLVSFLIQFIAVLVFWSLISPFVNEKLDFIQAMAFLPLGMMSLALPIAPSGLGVGHAIFQKLFEFSGIENGASLFNIYFVVTLMVNLLGVVPYLLSRQKK